MDAAADQVPRSMISMWLPHAGMQAMVTHYGEDSDMDETGDTAPETMTVDLSYDEPGIPFIYLARMRGSRRGPLIEAVTIAIAPDVEQAAAEITPAVANRIPWERMMSGAQEALGWDLGKWAEENVRRVTPARGDRYPDEHYKFVATAYDGATRAGQSGTQFIMDFWKTSEGSANRWIGKARELGYLPPPLKSKGGRPRKPQG